MIKVYTDGACSKNPGPGGWGLVVIKNDKVEYMAHGGAEETTNNRMELTAIINAYKYCREKYYGKDFITIYSDSAYCVRMINEWIDNWARNDWINSKKKQVENIELVQELHSLINESPSIVVEKIKGHCGHTYNEMADELARRFQEHRD